MRPLSLTLSGFRSQAGTTEISFEKRSLVAIVGPTGAGKTSILDGICYALYGKTPRVQSGTGRLVCSQCERARVSMVFELDGREYEVHRSIPAASDDYLLDRGSDERITGKTAIDNRIEEILGLDFPAFGSTVMLAQNEFALFLAATTTERTKILKGVFGIERIDELRKAAVGRISAIKLEIAEITGQRKSIPEDAPSLLKLKRAEIKSLDERTKLLAKAIGEEAGLEERRKEIAAETQAAEAELKSVAGLLDRLPAVAELTKLAGEERDAQSSLKAAEAVVKKSAQAEASARTALTSLEKKLGSEADLTRAEAKAENLDFARAESTRVTALVKSHTATSKDLDRKLVAARKQETDMLKAFEAARDERVAAERTHAAHALRPGLKKGEPCPVCEQKVTTLPKAAKIPGLAAFEKAEKAALAKHESARIAAAELDKRIAGATAEAGGLERELAAHTAAIAKLEAELAKLLGKVADPTGEIEARLGRLAATREVIEAAAERRIDAEASLERATDVVGSLATRRRGVAAVLIEIAARVDIDAPDIEASAEQLIERCDHARGALVGRRDTLASKVEKSQVAIAEVNEGLTELRAKLGIEDGAVSQALAQAKGDKQVGEHVAADLEAKIALSAELDAKEKGLGARRKLFDQLADDLRDATFIHFLLEDRRRLLSELASERLRAMTGRYRFDDEGNFDIVDEFDADRKRDIETLSGGETFLAALALALGLSETAMRHGGRVQSFFLDEGFGSLDPESFDLALDGIERIVDGDRLIGLVSHVPALAARVDDKIVLGKDENGMSVLLSGASL